MTFKAHSHCGSYLCKRLEVINIVVILEAALANTRKHIVENMMASMTSFFIAAPLKRAGVKLFFLEDEVAADQGNQGIPLIGRQLGGISLL